MGKSRNRRVYKIIINIPGMRRHHNGISWYKEFNSLFLLGGHVDWCDDYIFTSAGGGVNVVQVIHF
jgi:hypothetical protein